MISSLSLSKTSYYVSGVEGDTAPHMEIKGNYLYITRSYNGLYIIDISDPYNPSFVNSIEYSNGTVVDFKFYDKYIFIALLDNNNNSVVIYDISDIFNPKYVNIITNAINYTNANVHLNYIQIKNNYLFTSSGKIYDISNLKDIKEINKFDEYATEPEQGAGLLIQGDYLYTSYGNNIKIYNISNPESPKTVKIIKGYRLYYIKDNYLFATKGVLDTRLGGEITIFDISSPQFPKIIGNIDISFYRAYGSNVNILVDKSYLYFCQTGDFPPIIFDLDKVFECYKYEPEICENAGGYWYDDKCNSEPMKCDKDHIFLCKNETECKKAGGYWHDGKCNEKEATCDENHLYICNTEEKCKENGGFWFYDENICCEKCNNDKGIIVNGKCYTCSSDNISVCTNRIDCDNAGGFWTGRCIDSLNNALYCFKWNIYYWYDNKCHHEPSPNLESITSEKECIWAGGYPIKYNVGFGYRYKCISRSEYELQHTSNINAYPSEPLESIKLQKVIKPSDQTVYIALSNEVYLQPILKVDKDDIGKEAKLLIYVYIPKQSKGFMLPAINDILKEEQRFTNIPDPIDFIKLKDFIGDTFDVYYGYQIGKEIKYNAYKVNIVESKPIAPDCIKYKDESSCNSVKGCVYEEAYGGRCILNCKQFKDENSCINAFDGNSCEWSGGGLLFGKECYWKLR